MRAVLVAGLIGLMSAGVPPAAAQVLTGRVVDRDGRPLGDVEVRLLPEEPAAVGSVGRTVTGDDGAFSLLAADGGFRLRADRIGYAPFRSDPLALRASDSLEVRITLWEVPVPLEGLEVTASRRPWWEVLEPPGLWGFYDRMDRYGAEGRGRFFTRADLVPWRGVPVARALDAVVPALRAEQDARRPGQYLLRGPAGCLPLVFVDGVHVPLRMIGAGGRVLDELPLDMIVDPYGLVAVETYRGMSQAPVELTAPRTDTDLRCTVVGLWTRRR